VALFTYPAERPLPRKLGFVPSGRRVIHEEILPFDLGGCSGKLKRARWREELSPVDGGQVESLLQLARCKGRVIAVDSFVGVRYWEERYPDFESFVRGVATVADALPRIRCSIANGDIVQWRAGTSGDTPLLFLINEGEAADVELSFDRGLWKDRPSVTDITTGERHRRINNSLRLRLSAGGYHVLRFDP